MTGVSRITTEKAEIKLLKNGILKMTIFPNSNIDLNSAIEITDAAEVISGTKIHAHLIDIRKMMFMSSDARKHFKNLDNPNISATAILIDSMLHKTLVNMYFKFTSPKISTRVFANEKEARAWLNNKMKEAKEKINSDVLF